MHGGERVGETQSKVVQHGAKAEADDADQRDEEPEDGVLRANKQGVPVKVDERRGAIFPVL